MPDSPVSLSGVSLATRAEREAMARALREEDLTMRQIAGRMGVATSTVDGWLNDPGGVRLAARKKTYAGECIDCGGPCDGASGNARLSTRCAACAARSATENRRWSLAAVTEALRVWAEAHGRAPTASEAKLDPTLPQPNVAAILEAGGWQALLVDLGLKSATDRRGCGRGPGSVTHDDCLDAIFAYRERGTLMAAAEVLGVGDTTVRNRMIVLPEGRKLLMSTTKSNGHRSESRAVIVLRRETERCSALIEQKHEEIKALEAERSTLNDALETLAVKT